MRPGGFGVRGSSIERTFGASGWEGAVEEQRGRRDESSASKVIVKGVDC